jgi:hypothetical protein
MRRILLSLALASLSLPLLAATSAPTPVSSSAAAAPSDTKNVASIITTDRTDCLPPPNSIPLEAAGNLTPIEMSVRITHGHELMSESKMSTLPTGADTPTDVSRDIPYVAQRTPAGKIIVAHVTDGYSSLLRAVPLANDPAHLVVSYQVNLAELESMTNYPTSAGPDQYIQLPQVAVQRMCGTAILKEGQPLNLVSSMEDTGSHGLFGFFAHHPKGTPITIQISWKALSQGKSTPVTQAAP